MARQLTPPRQFKRQTVFGSGGIALIPRWFASTSRPVFIIAAGIAIAACSPIVNQRGNLPDAVVVDSIELGAQSRDEVARMLGTPTTVATFGGEVWYYISARTETVAFLAPYIVDQRVVAIAFDDTGRVKSIDRYDLADGQEIELDERVTPTGGKTLGFFEQIIGNFGRFADQSESQ